MDKLQNCVEVFRASSRRKHSPSICCLAQYCLARKAMFSPLASQVGLPFEMQAIKFIC